METIEQ